MLYRILIVCSFFAFIKCNVFFGSDSIPRQQCYEKNYCDTAVADCMGGLFLVNMFLEQPKSAEIPKREQVVKYDESSISDPTLGNTFQNAVFVYAPVYSYTPEQDYAIVTNYEQSGTIGQGGDIDIYYAKI